MTDTTVVESGVFRREIRIRFSHCDPAGIVYYPNYFDMMNGVVEDWFTTTFPDGFAGFIMADRSGLPIAHVECDFVRPSRMGDVVTLSLRVERVGRSSVTWRFAGDKDGERRLSARIVSVATSLDTHRSVPLPDALRAALLRFPGRSA